MKQKNEIDFLTEWAVWGHLSSKTDLELILLKGHLLLEIMLEVSLKRNEFKDYENFSFYRKITILETFDTNDQLKKDFIISSLKDINKFRNSMAHEFNFDISNGNFEIWATTILSNLRGEKFTKYTHRTKIVHAFSVLAKNILDLH